MCQVLLYTINDSFRQGVDILEEKRETTIDTTVSTDKRIISHVDSKAVTDVYYTIEDGQVVRHSDTTVIYKCEATTVIYTCATLGGEPSVTYTHHDASAPDCENDGNVEYWKASDGKYYADETGETELTDTTDQATGHDWGEPSFK